MYNALASVVVLFTFVVCCVGYCTRIDPCWPTEAQWDSLAATLEGKLTPLNTSSYDICYAQGTNAYGISAAGNGVCMHAHNCRSAFCDGQSAQDTAAYSAEMKSVSDIQTAVDFANQHDIPVTIKTSGHSYSGSSSGKDTLMLWMANFPKAAAVQPSFTDSCGTVTEDVLYVNGGETWGDAYAAVGSEFHLVGGGGLTVSAAGGWLMGGGLSALSRLHGIGVDNVLSFDMVLANTSHVRVDACSYPDLFWALRGGGGGSFGVVTSARYKLHPVSNTVLFVFAVSRGEGFLDLVDLLVDKWVDVSPTLDRRWGGYWGLDFWLLYFQGNETEARSTLISEMESWRDSLGTEAASRFSVTVVNSPSYWDSRGRGSTTDATGQPFLDIASRLIPRDFVVNNAAQAKAMLKYLARHGFSMFNYFLGGAVNDVAPNATSVNPALRRAIWQIETFGGGRFNSEYMMSFIRSQTPDSGSGYNHGKRNEPDWRNAFWGSNYVRLGEIKAKYDEDNRFNCWHCVGYVGPEAALSVPRDDIGVPPTPPPEDTTWVWVVVGLAAVAMFGLVILSVRHGNYAVGDQSADAK